MREESQDVGERERVRTFIKDSIDGRMSGEKKEEGGERERGLKNGENKAGRREKWKREQLRAREGAWQREGEREGWVDLGTKTET